jgi:hypothetical protein
MYRNNTTVANSLEAVMSYLNGLDDNELVNAHNTYARENSSDDEIYSNDEDFFNTFFEGKTNEAVRAVCYGEYRYTDEYVMFNGYGNLESFNNPSAHIDLIVIANDILENASNYDIELEECFTLDNVIYEGSEDDAREQYEEYKTEIEEENKELEEDEEKTEILSFTEWVKENIATID